MIYRIRFTKEAREDLKRLYAFLLDKNRNADRQALTATQQAIEAIKFFPYTCRKALGDTPFLRELLMHFGATGYVALFEIEDQQTITIIAVRHQREEDFY